MSALIYNQFADQFRVLLHTNFAHQVPDTDRVIKAFRLFLEATKTVSERPQDLSRGELNHLLLQCHPDICSRERGYHKINFVPLYQFDKFAFPDKKKSLGLIIRQQLNDLDAQAQIREQANAKAAALKREKEFVDLMEAQGYTPLGSDSPLAKFFRK